MFFQKSIGKFLFSAALVLVGMQVNAAPGKTGSKAGGSRSARVSVSPEMQATKHVRGTVLDETGQGVPGASIVVKGETRGVMADENGHFEIDVKSSDVLIVYYLGYEEQAVTVGNQTELVIKLVPTANALDEVTVVAYGAQRKASVIGSISSVNVDKLSTGVRGNLSTGLAGQLAGIVSVQTTGEPGSSANFWIRGINTFGANSTPLVIVDGVERSMDLVDVEDIASFSILKDATATAVYGVRGANGIIIITTKRGAESKPKVQIKLETGITQPIKLPKVASTEQWIDYFNDLYIDQGMTEGPISEYQKEMYLSGADPDMYPSIDWVSAIFKNLAQTDKLNVSVTGGNKNVRYYVGGSYYFEDGIFNVANNNRYNAQLNYNKFSFRSNVDINITKSTTLGLSLSTAYTMKNAPNTDRGELYSYTLYTTPIATPLIYSDGTLARPALGRNTYNDLNNSGYRRFNEIVAQSLVSLTQDFSDIITEGLTANVKFSWDALNNITLYRYLSPSTYRLKDRDNDGNPIYEQTVQGTNYMTLGTGRASNTTINTEASINYERQFANAHRVGAMLLFSMRSYSNNVPAGYVYAFPYKNMGLAGRTTYSFKDRYFAEFNFGYNGSENFAPGHRFGFFPAAAVGYMISNEPYWDNLRKTVNMLKLKTSYGKIGNDQIGGNRRFAYNTTVNTGAAGFIFGTNGGVNGGGISTGEYGNPNVSWEEATKFNLGIELGLFNDLEFHLDYFSDKRDGIFIQRESTPTVVGINVAQWVNIGRMDNSGVDMSIEYNHTFPSGLLLSARGNYTYNHNKVVYNDKPDQLWKYQNTAGFAYGQLRGLIAEGLFKDQEDIDNWPTQTFGSVRPGDIKYRDVNGDGVVDTYDEVAIGYQIHPSTGAALPEINYGFGVSLGYKGFDASVFFSGVGHYTRIISGNLVRGTSYNVEYQGQILADVAEKRWTLSNPNPNAEYPRLTLSNNPNNDRSSTYWLRDMSFLRIKNAEIGYTLPKNITKKAGISTMRIYLQGVNLLTFSKFKLWDPEITSSFGNGYPTMRTVCLGANINF